MRLKLALLAIPIALLAAFFVYFQRPQLGASPASGSPVSAPSSAPIVAANPASAPAVDAAVAPAASSATGVKMISSYAASADTSMLLKSITVVGQGEVKIAPDIAYVGVGVRTRETTAKAAQEKNNQAMAAVIAKIKALGLDDKDIQTTGISLYPAYDNGNTISGYDAANGVTVRADIAKVGPILDAAVEAGANSGLSVGFGLKDPSAATLQALEAATKDARAHADAIAKGLGVTIKEVQIAIEGSPTTPVVMRDTSYGIAPADAKMSAPTPVQSGELTVTSTVQVIYSY